MRGDGNSKGYTHTLAREQELKDLERLFFEFYSYFKATTITPESDNLIRLQVEINKFRSKYLDENRKRN